MTEDIRWKQRFNNYLRALRLLEICVPENPALQSEKDILASVQAYEMTVELAWNLLQDYMKDLGLNFNPTPKTVIREAYNKEIISDAQVWIDAVKLRNLTSHTYDEDVAKELMENIIHRFLPAFQNLSETFTRYVEEDE